jgi:hypothetical protein
MTDIIDKEIFMKAVETKAPVNAPTVVQTSMRATMIKNITEQLNKNKLYVGILIFVIALGVGLYTFFIKNKSKLNLLKNLCVKPSKKEVVPSAPPAPPAPKKTKLQHPAPVVKEESSDELEEYDLQNIEEPLTMQQLTNSELKEIEEELSSS